MGLISVIDHETNSQNLVKEKLIEYTAITPLCRSSLLVELMNEMTELKQELDDRLGKICALRNYIPLSLISILNTEQF